MPNFIRPSVARTFLSLGAILRSKLEDCTTIPMTTPTATNAIPVIDSNVQEYVIVDREANTAVCSGTVLKTADTWGIAVEDHVAGSTESLYITSCPTVLMPLDSLATVTVGADAYIIPSTGLITHDATGNDWVGRFKGASEASPPGLDTHADGWAPLSFGNAEK